MKRVLNTIMRAVSEFGLNVDMNDSMEDIFCKAMDVIEKNVEYDYIDECDRNRHFTHINWSDGKGFDLEADGDFVARNERDNTYFRYENGGYREIEWFDHNDETDYVEVYDTIDSEGLRVKLVCRC